jgi:hypothetical protein
MLLETVREYALEQVQARDEEDTYRRRHLAYFLALAEEAEPALFGPTRIPWLDRLELELDNLRAALSLTLGSGVAEQAERLATAFSSVFGEQTDRLAESRRWLEAALALDGDVAPTVRAATLRILGFLTFRHGEFQRARAARGGRWAPPSSRGLRAPGGRPRHAALGDAAERRPRCRDQARR